MSGQQEHVSVKLWNIKADSCQLTVTLNAHVVAFNGAWPLVSGKVPNKRDFEQRVASTISLVSVDTTVAKIMEITFNARWSRARVRR